MNSARLVILILRISLRGLKMLEKEPSKDPAPKPKEDIEDTNDKEKRGCLASLISIAGAAFLLSFVLAALNWHQALSGASITVLGPTHVYIYRSGSEDNYPLAVAVQIPVANAAEGYSDFLTEAELEIEGIGRRYPVTMIVNPTLFLDKKNASDSCNRSSSTCLALGRLAIVERDWDHITRVPAGDAHNLYYSFEITCIPNDCPRIADYQTALRHLSLRRNLHFKVHLRFHGDGRRVVDCNINRFAYNRILDRHWQSATCSTSNSTDLRPWYRRWFGLG